jgi:hypothetical protein
MTAMSISDSVAGEREPLLGFNVFAHRYARICVGRHLANNTIFINIVTVLWALKIEPPKDFNGKAIIPNTDTVVNDGLVM